MARRSVAYNSLEDKIDIVTGDIKEAAEQSDQPLLCYYDKSAVYDRRAWSEK